MYFLARSLLKNSKVHGDVAHPLLLLLRLLPCQVVEESPVSGGPSNKVAPKGSSPSTKVASPWSGAGEGAWQTLNKGGGAEHARWLPREKTKLDLHCLGGGPGCEVIQLKWDVH